MAGEAFFAEPGRHCFICLPILLFWCLGHVNNTCETGFIHSLDITENMSVTVWSLDAFISACLSFPAMVSFIFTLTPVDCLLSCSVYLGDLEPGKVSPNIRACVIPRDIVFVFFILTNMDCFSWVACYWRLISNSRRVILMNSEPGCVSQSALLEPSLLQEPGDLAATQKMSSCLLCLYFFFFFFYFWFCF